MAITITWTEYVTRTDLEGNAEHYKIGKWYNDGVEQGDIEIPATSDGTVFTSNSALCAVLALDI
jgi:hypothetical protein